MIETTKREHRFAASAVLAVGGAALALATWRSGDGGFAVALAVFYAIAAIVAWFWAGGSGDVAALLRAGGDERQQSIDLRATAYAGSAATAFSLAAAVVQAARGGDAFPYTFICAVGGAAYILAVALLRGRS